MRQTGLIALMTILGCISAEADFSGNAAAEDKTVVPFSFAVTADQRQYAGEGTYDSADYFRGVCEAISSLGGGAFMVSPGDIDPPDDSRWTIEQYIGVDYLWYPVVGNHEAETASDMDWLRAYNPGGNSLPHVVNVGPSGTVETTFSFDYENAHFVVLNEYFNGVSDTGTNGDVVNGLFSWLEDDLKATDQAYTFVLGHEPAYPQPDEDNGRARHVGDSLDEHRANRDRFWNLLREERVTAYLCGHTHGYSAVKIDGVWQLDAGHARGAGDTSAPSTFIMIDIDAEGVSFETFRDDHDGSYDYDDIVHGGVLASSAFSEEIFTFQDGFSPDPGYAGTQDTTIKSDDPGTNFGSSDNLEVDGVPAYAAILKWDVSSIPPGSTVTYASVTLSVTNHSSGQSYELYEMKRNWVESEANWNEYSSGNPWQTAGADGLDDRGLTPLGKAATSDTGQFVFNLNADGIALVESWIDAPSTNNGMIVLDYANSDGLDFESREAVTAGNRPKLTVETATHIALASLDAAPVGGNVSVTWETTSENDNAGFHIWRSEAENGVYSQINASLIPAEGGPGAGATYEYVDEDVQAGLSYFYKLEAEDLYATGRFFGPVSTTVPQEWSAATVQASTRVDSPGGGSGMANSMLMFVPVAAFVLAWKGTQRRRRTTKG